MDPLRFQYSGLVLRLASRLDARLGSRLVSRLVVVTALGAIDGAAEQDDASIPLDRKLVYVRATVTAGAVVQFSYSYDNHAFSTIGAPFTARPGRWVGAKIGLFAAGVPGNRHGAALFDWFRIAGRD